MPLRMNEDEITASFDAALGNNHIFPYYQPQINHSTGRMVGCEALMRWDDPDRGMQFPSDFIPVLEKHDLMYRADLHIFYCACRFLRQCLEENRAIVPISVNMSRYDILHSDYVDVLEEIRKKFDLPVKYLRIEITESSAAGGLELISSVLSRLQQLGYVVEMDDFGSGYSSLNILKDLKVDIIKLDLNFLNGELGGRGGIILSSVVQMAKWLNTPIIAEGVETVEQADYLKSIGCDYIQGYLYAKPMPEQDFCEKMSMAQHEPLRPALSLIETLRAGKFWNPDSMETLIFSNFVGAACLFNYRRGRAELLRVNKKYVQELGMNLSEYDLVRSDPWQCCDEINRKILEDTILKAVASNEEESCETWRDVHSKCCGDDKICVRSHMRVVGTAGEQYLLYAMIQNVTAEKKNYNDLYNSERRFRFASEQANVYAWEYTIATREMRPCFRCMRDLNLPPLLKNYPEPAIEAGIFPPDYADMYREWHQKLAEGVPSLEAVIPLTVGRIPFHVRYTTEFDENGKPLKAYGSATLVVDKNETDT